MFQPPVGSALVRSLRVNGRRPLVRLFRPGSASAFARWSAALSSSPCHRQQEEPTDPMQHNSFTDVDLSYRRQSSHPSPPSNCSTVTEDRSVPLRMHFHDADIRVMPQQSRLPGGVSADQPFASGVVVSSTA